MTVRLTLDVSIQVQSKGGVTDGKEMVPLDTKEVSVIKNKTGNPWKTWILSNTEMLI